MPVLHRAPHRGRGQPGRGRRGTWKGRCRSASSSSSPPPPTSTAPLPPSPPTRHRASTLPHPPTRSTPSPPTQKKLQCANTAQEARDFSFDDPAITFAHVFGETGGHGDEKDKAFAVLVAAKGKGQANSIHALCRYMMWGGRTGNTIQGFLCGSLIGKPRPSKSPLMIPVQILFELVLTLWYSFLFLIGEHGPRRASRLGQGPGIRAGALPRSSRDGRLDRLDRPYRRYDIATLPTHPPSLCPPCPP